MTWNRFPECGNMETFLYAVIIVKGIFFVSKQTLIGGARQITAAKEAIITHSIAKLTVNPIFREALDT